MERPGDRGRHTGEYTHHQVLYVPVSSSDPPLLSQCSELGDLLVSLSYSPSLQRLTVVVLRARGLQLLSDAGRSSSISTCVLTRITDYTFSSLISSVFGVLCCPGVCVQVSLQIHTQVVKIKCSCVAKAGKDPHFNHRMTFKLRAQNLDEACLRFELQQPNDVRSGERAKQFQNLISMLSHQISSGFIMNFT